MDRAYVVHFMSTNTKELSIAILAAYTLSMLLLAYLEWRNGGGWK